MIFYKKITICNLFAYNGTQSVNFSQKDGKPMYLIFGKNGFGKTSFIRSIKLLFAGSGLLEISQNVPNVVLDFADNRVRGVFTPKVLLLGQNSSDGWLGALNKSAVSKNENNFFVELCLQENEITIKREWSLYPNLSENLTFSKNGEALNANEAKE